MIIKTDFATIIIFFLKNKKVISLSVIALAFVIASALFINSNLNYKRGMEAIDNGKYQVAIEYLDKSYGGKAKESRIIALELNELDMIYKRGIHQYDIGQYVSAIKNLASVTSLYPKYDEAQKKANDSKIKYADECLIFAKQDYSLKDYSGAYNLIQEVLQYNPILEEAIELNKVYKATYTEEQNKIAKQKAEAVVKAVAEKTKRLAAEAKAEKARKKSEGVRIGMSQQDVLDSSWGRPYDINKTTTVYGTDEQWCYDNYNYLYFEDGVLTSIQN